MKNPNEQIVKNAYYVMLIPEVPLPKDISGSNSDFWEFMRDYSSWPKEGLRHYNALTGKFE